MSEMIERVAKAMWDTRRSHANNTGIFLEFWGDGTFPIANGIMDEARAAITAMREPTEEMMVSAENAFEPLLTFADKEESGSYIAWRAMIDAALETAKQV